MSHQAPKARRSISIWLLVAVAATVLLPSGQVQAKAPVSVERAQFHTLWGRAESLARQARHAGPATVKKRFEAAQMTLEASTLQLRRMSDRKGDFYLFVFKRPEPVLGFLAQSDGTTSGSAWRLAADDPNSAVTREALNVTVPSSATAGQEEACELVVEGVLDAVQEDACQTLPPNLSPWCEAAVIVGAGVGIVVCFFKGFPVGGSAHWDPCDCDPTSNSGFSVRNQCCGNPLVVVVDMSMDSEFCLRNDYPPAGNGVCHTVNGNGEKVKKDVLFRVTYHWPNGGHESIIYQCQCTYLHPQNIIRQMNVEVPGKHMVYIEVEESPIVNDPINGRLVNTGSLARQYNLTS